MAIKIKKANIDISALSSNVLIDSISGLKNKQAFDIELHTEALRCQRYRRNLSIALIDIDLSHFTREKDNHSQVHEIIRNIPNNIKSKIRTSDLVYHTDTQQFAILFPETELKGQTGIQMLVAMEVMTAGNLKDAAKTVETILVVSGK